MKSVIAHALVVMASVAGCASVAHAQMVGQQVYQAHCAVCHQADAQGAPGLAPPLQGRHWIKLASARQYVPGVLLAGMHGVLALENGNFNGVMPPQNRLSDEEIAAATNYLFINVNGQEKWPALQASDVAQLRRETPLVAQLRALRKQALAQ